MDLESLYSDYSFEDQDFYAAASPHKNFSSGNLVSLVAAVRKPM
jgi:hypothetical protein